MGPKDEDIYDILDRHGIEDPRCGASNLPGWHGLIDDLIKDILVMGWNKDLQQIKEKFGGLRFYVGDASDEVHHRIHVAERESFGWCEECGAPGTLTRGGWLLTLCPEHARAHGRGEGESSGGMGNASGAA